MSKTFHDILHPDIEDLLLAGKIGVLRTDTLYGVVALAEDKSAVEKVYTVRGRNKSKPCIVLISSIKHLYDSAPSHIQAQLEKVWPGKTSVIIPSHSAPSYLTRDGTSLAYRVPGNQQLRTLLDRVGPLIAPSANPEGEPPAKNMQQAKEYFQDGIDFYVDGGEVIENIPSALIIVKDDGTIEKLR